jgi:hypothetical protein
LGGLVVHHDIIQQIHEKVKHCSDEGLLDLILKLLLESGY